MSRDEVKVILNHFFHFKRKTSSSGPIWFPSLSCACDRWYVSKCVGYRFLVFSFNRLVLAYLHRSWIGLCHRSHFHSKELDSFPLSKHQLVSNLKTSKIWWMEFRGPSITRTEHVSEVQNHRSLGPVNHGAEPTPLCWSHQTRPTPMQIYPNPQPQSPAIMPLVIRNYKELKKTGSTTRSLRNG